MKKNIGSADKAVRIILGLLIIVLGFVFQSWLGLLGIVFLGTAFTGTCPAYLPVHFSTNKKVEVKKI
jgi:type IV secretory pathway TrbD component